MQNVQCKMQNGGSARIPARHVRIDGHSAKPFDLGERFLDFADRVVSVVEALPDTRVGRRIADQLLRSGTSPLGNYEEACAAESKRDFVHKLRVCLKEIRGSRAWLRLTAHRKLLKADRLLALIDESEQLARIIGQSIATAKGLRNEKRAVKVKPH